MERGPGDYSKESILIVDDNTILRETLENLLTAIGIRPDSVANGVDALEELKDKAYTFLLTDMKMPGMGGMELIQKAHQEFPEISIIAMTGYAEGYRYIDVINAGASDFLKKPFDIEELEAKIRRIIDDRDLRRELSKQSITDSLTGLFNHRYFYMRLNEEVTRARRQGHPLSLILLDLDNFKTYNDSQGHLAGDEVLKNVGRLISKSIREGVDTGYRYGGDEFAIILIDADLNITREICKRVEKAFEQSSEISASVGYRIFSSDMSANDLVLGADKSLYEAKTKAKGNKCRR